MPKKKKVSEYNKFIKKYMKDHVTVGMKREQIKQLFRNAAYIWTHAEDERELNSYMVNGYNYGV